MDRPSYWLFIAALAVSLTVPRILSGDYYLHLLIIIGINIILANSLDILVGYAGTTSMAHGAFWGAGAYAAALLALHLNSQFVVGLVAAVVIAVVFGLVIGYPALRLRGHFFVIATFVFGILVEIFFRNLEITRGPMGLPGIPPARITWWGGNGSLVFTDKESFYYLVLFFVLGVAVLKFRLIHSKMGRSLIAIREDEILAKSIGVNIAFYKILAFSISSACAGIAGTLYAHYLSFVSPEAFSPLKSFELFVMVLVGGRGTMVGPWLGVILLVLMEEWVKIFSPALAKVAYGLILLLIIIYLPSGIAGKLRELKAKMEHAE